MEEFKFNFSKPEDQEQFNKLDQEKKNQIESVAFDEATKIQEITSWLNDESVVELNSNINKNQEHIELEILNKIKDIFVGNFAVHGSNIDSLASILQDGILSKSNFDNYTKKNLGKKRLFESERTSRGGYEEQGADRISTFSYSVIFKLIDKISNKDNCIDTLIYHTKRNAEVESDKEVAYKIEEEIFNKYGANILQYDSFFTETGQREFIIKIDKPIEISEKENLKNLFNLLILSTLGYGSRFNDEKDEYYKNLGNRILQKLNIKYKAGNFNNVDLLLQLDNVSTEDMIMLYESLDLSEIKSKFLQGLYSDGWGIINFVIDLNTISATKKRDFPSMLNLNGEIQSSASGYSYKHELPIAGRIKSTSIDGIQLHAREAINSSYPAINLLKTIIGKINLDKTGRLLTDSDIELINSVKNSINISDKELLMFASKICNYELIKKDLKAEDVVFAIANFYKKPVYDEIGNVIWPKNIDHEKIANKEF